MTDLKLIKIVNFLIERMLKPRCAFAYTLFSYKNVKIDNNEF